MFEIEYNGGNSVLITTKEMALAIDPNVEMLGLKSKKTKFGVQIATEKRFLVDVNEDVITLEGPGEYEVGPYAIRAAAAQRHIDQADQPKQSTVYHIDVMEYRLAIVGNIDPSLGEDQLETLGTVDILIVPVGGNGYTLDASSATKIVRQVEPKIVIPVHYADSGITYEVPQDSIDAFISEVGAPVEEVQTLKLKTAAAIPPSLTIYRLSRQ